MKKVWFLLSLMVCTVSLHAKMIKQRVTVIVPDTSIISVLYQGSIESAIMEDAAVILEHSDSVKADTADPERFLAVSGLNGYILLTRLSNRLQVSFYNNRGLVKEYSVPVQESQYAFQELAARIAGDVREVYPELVQKVITQDKEIRSQVSSLEYFKPTLAVGGRLQWSPVQFDVTLKTNGQEDSFFNAGPLVIYTVSPGLYFSYDYRKFSASMELQYFLGGSAEDNGAALTMNQGAFLDTRIGMWFINGFLNINLGIQAYYLNYTLNHSTFTETFPLVIPRIYPHIRLRFSDRFMFGLTGIGKEFRLAGGMPANTGDSLFQFAFSWDFMINKHLRILADMIIFAQPHATYYLRDNIENHILVGRSSLGLTLIYQWNPGGKS